MEPSRNRLNLVFPSVKDYQADIAALAADLRRLSSEIGIEALAEWLLVARFLAQGGAES